VTLTLNADRILRDQRVRREDDQAVNEGLADEHPIERVVVKARKARKMEHRVFFKSQRQNSTPTALVRDVLLRRRR